MRLILRLTVPLTLLVAMAAAGETEYRAEDGHFYAGWYWETKGKDAKRALDHYRTYLKDAGNSGSFVARAKARIATIQHSKSAGPAPDSFPLPDREDCVVLGFREVMLRRNAMILARKGFPYQAALLHAQAAHRTARAHTTVVARRLDDAIEKLEADILIARVHYEPTDALAKTLKGKRSERARVPTRAGLASDLALHGLTALRIRMAATHGNVGKLLRAASAQLKRDLDKTGVSAAEKQDGAAFLKRINRVIEAYDQGKFKRAQRLADAEWARIMAFRPKRPIRPER